MGCLTRGYELPHDRRVGEGGQPVSNSVERRTAAATLRCAGLHAGAISRWHNLSNEFQLRQLHVAALSQESSQ